MDCQQNFASALQQLVIAGCRRTDNIAMQLVSVIALLRRRRHHIGRYVQCIAASAVPHRCLAAAAADTPILDADEWCTGCLLVMLNMCVNAGYNFLTDRTPPLRHVLNDTA